MSDGEPSPRSLRLLWFGSYATGPGYPRSETLIAGLRARGHTVDEVHAPLFDGASQRVRAARGGGLVRSAWRQARAASRLARGWFRTEPHDVLVVGHGGLIDAPLARLLQNVERVPVVLDDFVPLYDAAIRDRGLADPSSWRARTLRTLERLSGRSADLVLADTAEHARLLESDLGLPPDRVAVVPIAQPDPGPPSPLPPLGPSHGPLRVLLVATFIPLHGVETVLDAAGRLDPTRVRITIVGAGQALESLRGSLEAAPVVDLVPQFVEPDEIARRLAASHVGLGVFGDTPKAARVVPFKAVLTLAGGRALVTRDSPAAREALGPTDDDPEPSAVLVPPADGAALAAALDALAGDPGVVTRLAAAARRRYLARFTPECAADALLAALARRDLLLSRRDA